MASKKRKSSLPESPAKRQKLGKETKGPPAALKKRNGVTNKSKPRSTQSKNKSALPTNKAIKKLQSPRSEVGQKRKTGNVKVAKKSNGKNVPAKQKAVAKDMTASKRNTPKPPNNASKKNPPASVRKTAARATSVQSKTHKVVKSSAKSQPTKRVRNEPVKKNISKPGKKTVQAKKVVKTVQSKETKPSKQTPSKNKVTAVNLKRMTPSMRTSERNTKLDCKKDTGPAAESTKKLSSTRRKNQKPLVALKQKTSIVEKKKPGSAQAGVTKKSGPRTKVKKEVKTESPENAKGNSPVHPPVPPVMAPSDAIKNTAQDHRQSTSCSVEEHAPKKKTSSKSTTLTTGTSTGPLKRKKDSNKPVVKMANKGKKQKVTKPGSDKKNLDVPTENDQKSKRISILDLCNEIAGEIESDTVEVVKETPHTPDNPSEDTHIEKKEDSPMEASLPPPSEHTPIMPSNRFFPSRKPLQVKRKIEQKTSPLTKKSKWNKIKLKKNFSPNNILRSQTVLPNLESIRAKASVQQTVMETSNTPKTSYRKPDVTLSKDIKRNELVRSEKVKNKTVQAAEGENQSRKQSAENGLLENHIKHELEMALDEGFRLHLDSSPENSPIKKAQMSSPPLTRASEKQRSECKQLTDQMAASADRGNAVKSNVSATNHVPSDANVQKEIRKLKEADKNSSSQPIIDAGQKRFGAITCNVCGMLYTASNPEDETQHLLFHNQFISAVKYVGWKKERIVSEYPDGKIIMVLPDDPKYALKKVEEIREMVDNDLGFQQVPLQLHSRTKTFLFISSDKKVVGCLIAEHIQWGYRVIEDNIPSDNCDKDQISERVKAWCCSTNPEPAICGVSRIWVFSMMRRKKIASRMLECLRNHFIYGSHLNKDEIAFSDPTPDGKLFATHYCGTGQFLVYNFVSGHHPQS
ncbi:N-acetyltransferase ESCO1 [Dendropsophus ebraccatus]|uniref:N-acetyltransferase ESCO1 n=1 Tax=Dendropsophus ebraccatus TaxID=150705 RepID=UPI003831636D